MKGDDLKNVPDDVADGRTKWLAVYLQEIIERTMADVEIKLSARIERQLLGIPRRLSLLERYQDTHQIRNVCASVAVILTLAGCAKFVGWL